MSGGSSGTDPYHQKDPPKKKHIPNEMQFKSKVAGGRVLIVSRRIGGIIQKQKNKKKVYWYRCDGCHQAFPSRQRKYGKSTSCSLACKHKVQSQRYRGHKHPPESIKRMEQAAKKTWKDPDIAKRRREAAKTRKKPKQVHRKKKPKKVHEYSCSHCGKKFQTQRERELENKYCSRNCVGKSQRKGGYVDCDNPNCSKKVWKKPSHLEQSRHYCSTDCVHSDPYMKEVRSETSMGELNPNWKGGVGRLIGWERMANSIRDRDNHTCQVCGEEHEEGHSFPVHHMRPERLDGPDEPWNLVTLCPPCHYRADAQDGDFKIPQKPDGATIRDLGDLKEHWEEYKKRKGEE